MKECRKFCLFDESDQCKNTLIYYHCLILSSQFSHYYHFYGEFAIPDILFFGYSKSVI